jgi:hypothetical protein
MGDHLDRAGIGGFGEASGRWRICGRNARAGDNQADCSLIRSFIKYRF